ncbi:MAG: metal ABC transporter permease [Deltaproteobacteria bacterium]|nr:metal ABC transporter permease [Deltaproteobacteria bacterium]
MSPWKLMALPFLECLVLVGIHSYLGIHVIKRKVIFVDLALAQIAALGTIVALFVGLQPHTTGAYVFSLLFTFLGAAVFSLTRVRHEKIPQEAVIGLIYALAAAVAILVVDRAPHGAEHIKEILTGTILWVKWQTVLTAAIVYSAVGIFHYFFRGKFVLISNDPVEAYRRGISVRLWDFLFYMSFGLVITLSVHTAGVLLVFVFLIVPAIMAILITDRLLYQLLIGWGVGTFVSFIGLMASYSYDFPSGPMVVSVYGAALLVAALILYVARAKKRGAAIGYIASGAVATALIVLGFYLLGNILAPIDRDHGSHSHVYGDIHHHDHHDSHEHGSASQSENNDRSLLELLAPLDIVGKQKLLSKWTDSKELIKALEMSDDEELHITLAARLVEIDKNTGRAALVKIMENAEILLFRSEALSLLVKMSGDDFGFNPMGGSASKENKAALDRWRLWLKKDLVE